MSKVMFKRFAGPVLALTALAATPAFAQQTPVVTVGNNSEAEIGPVARGGDANSRSDVTIEEGAINARGGTAEQSQTAVGVNGGVRSDSTVEFEGGDNNNTNNNTGVTGGVRSDSTLEQEQSFSNIGNTRFDSRSYGTTGVASGNANIVLGAQCNRIQNRTTSGSITILGTGGGFQRGTGDQTPADAACLATVGEQNRLTVAAEGVVTRDVELIRGGTQLVIVGVQGSCSSVAAGTVTTAGAPKRTSFAASAVPADTSTCRVNSTRSVDTGISLLTSFAPKAPATAPTAPVSTAVDPNAARTASEPAPAND